jgi:hypothetical protein
VDHLREADGGCLQGAWPLAGAGTDALILEYIAGAGAVWIADAVSQLNGTLHDSPPLGEVYLLHEQTLGIEY